MSTKRPNDDERIAEQYFLGKGFRTEYEPLGPDTCPDYLLDGRVAVEVRRLNDNIVGSGQMVGVESAYFRIDRIISAIVEEAEQHVSTDVTWYVVPVYRRLLSIGKTDRRVIRDAIVRECRAGRPGDRRRIDVLEHLSLRVSATSRKQTSLVSAAPHDIENAIFAVEGLLRNTQIAILDKTPKALKSPVGATSWILALVNHLTVAMSNDTKAAFAGELVIPHPWERVVLINPLDPADGFVVDRR